MEYIIILISIMFHIYIILLMKKQNKDISTVIFLSYLGGTVSSLCSLLQGSTFIEAILIWNAGFILFFPYSFIFIYTEEKRKERKVA